MSGKGGRPKGGSAKVDNYEKWLPMNQSITNDKPKADTDFDESDIRSAIHDALVGNMGNLTDWLAQIGEADPVKAMTLFQSLAEYVLPKQQRTDSKQSGVNPIIINFEPSSKAVMPTETPRIYEKAKTHNNKTFDINDIIGINK